MTASPARSQQATYTNRRPHSSQTVSVSLDEDSSALGVDASHLRFEVSECVETKTVTTTTTTKRTFPPLRVRESRPLSRLDGKEYPLANKPLPPELASFSYSIRDLGADEATDELITSKKVSHPHRLHSLLSSHPSFRISPKSAQPSNKR